MDNAIKRLRFNTVVPLSFRTDGMVIYIPLEYLPDRPYFFPKHGAKNLL